MRRRETIMAAILAIAIMASPAIAQLALPSLGGVLPGNPVGVVDGLAAGTLERAGTAVADLKALADERLARLEGFTRANRQTVELDEARQPSRRGEVLLVDPDDEALKLAADKGFALVERSRLEGLDVAYARLATPTGVPLASALRTLRRALPGRTISADQLHFPSGKMTAAAAVTTAQMPLPRGGTLGLIDGGVGASALLAEQKGFAAGAPRTSEHAGAIVSLLAGAGAQRVFCADVYGTDPAGGSALAIARALGWMSTRGVPVVSISLVGPSNPLLERAMLAAQSRGMIVVAAVGNDGAAAPPAYPASYPGVIAVTGVDARGRVLIEAGRALHLDYAAPGADITVPGANGRPRSLRGTSYAAPLAAARIAAHRARSSTVAAAIGATDAEARRGNARTGRGVLCEACRTGL